MSPAAAQLADPASGARSTDAARSVPKVTLIGVHLTPYAIGCDQLGHNDDRRWKIWLAVPVLDIVKKVLARLRLKPAQIAAARQENGDIAIGLVDRSQILIEGDPANDDPAPLALLFGDIALSEVTAALQDLHRRGWTPSTLGAAQ